MDNPFAKAIAAAASASPTASGSVPIIPGRVLLVDGDGLAYYCAGNDDTDAGTARQNLIDKVKGAARQVGAERIVILLTGSGSNKGWRYAIARVKPYQGQRADARRPKNWQALRDYLTSGFCAFEVESTVTAEADDLFGWYAYNFPDDVVIYTQDKDMRMLPGRHLDWVSHRIHTVGYTKTMCIQRELMYNIVPIDSVFNDVQYGHRWFWLQMLHGDGADNIPGLPLATIKYGGSAVDPSFKLNKVGEAAAKKILAAHSDLSLVDTVALAYRSYYGERWLAEMLEQACLLWMRRVPSDWDDCLNPGGPMACFNDGEQEFAKAYFEIEHRIRTAEEINAAAKDN